MTEKPELEMPSFHNAWFDHGAKQWLGRKGAILYVLDPERKTPISRGYHTISLGTEGLFGELGNRRSMIQTMSPEEGLKAYFDAERETILRRTIDP